MSETPFLEIDRLGARYGRTRVLEDIRLGVAQGEFVALLGASGCGKTTLLRAIAGFLAPSAGAIRVAGRDITRLPPDRRDMALVFQSYALWPHMTVRQNMGYGLKVRRVARADAAAKVDSLIDLLGLSGLGDRNVKALSGGQRQRVALGRALAIDPKILLLDEPLSNLDARIRMTVRHEIRALQRRLGITAIIVTHDREEAMVIADRIVILNGGRIEQIGSPEEVYNRPQTPFVATFLGADNLVTLEAERAGGTVRLSGAAIPEPVALAHHGASALPPGLRIVVEARFRSEAARLLADDAGPAEPGVVFDGTVREASYPGGIWRHEVDVAGRPVLVDAEQRRPSGAAVRVFVPERLLFLFPRPDAGLGEFRPEAAEAAAEPAEA